MLKARVVGFNRTDESRYNCYSLIKSLEQRNIKTDFLAINEIEVRSQFFPQGTEVNNSDLIFNFVKKIEKVDITIFSDPVFCTDKDLVLSQKLERLKNTSSVFVNEIDNHREICNKVFMYKKLIAAGVPIPKTYFILCDAEDCIIDETVNMLGGYPVVLKNPIGTMGTEVFKCNNLQRVKDILNYFKNFYFIKNENPVVIQEYIDAKGLFICTRVVKDKIFPRLSFGSPYAESTFKSNISTDRISVACRVSSDLSEICYKAMSAAGLDTARIDIFIRDNKLLICELNSIGGIVQNEIACNVDISSLIVQAAINKFESL
jgi:RimK family alpha-L-glutamate ligase